MIVYRNPTVDHAGKMWELAEKSSLDLNSSYSYLMMAEYFSKSCIVAIENDNVVGFVTGFVMRDNPDTVFVWQIAVNPEYRGKSIAINLLQNLLLSTHTHNIEATVTPSNKASLTLFKKVAEVFNTMYKTDKGFDEYHFPDEHDAEMLVTVGPII